MDGTANKQVHTACFKKRQKILCPVSRQQVRYISLSRNSNPFCKPADRRLFGRSMSLQKGLGFRAPNLRFFLVRVRVRVYNGL